MNASMRIDVSKRMKLRIFVTQDEDGVFVSKFRNCLGAHPKETPEKTQ